MTFPEATLLSVTISDQIDKLSWHINNSKHYLIRSDFCPPYEWKINPLCNIYYNNSKSRASLLIHPCINCINYIFKAKDIDEIEPDNLIIVFAKKGDYTITGDYPCNFRRSWHVKLKRLNFTKSTARPMLYLEAAREFWDCTLRYIKEVPPEHIILNSSSDFGKRIIQIDIDIFKKYIELYKVLLFESSKAERLMKEFLDEMDKYPDLPVEGIR